MLVFARRSLALILLWTISVSAETPLNQARSSLEKWVETRQLISKAKSDWQTDKETIEQTLRLFERELKSVEEQISKVSTNSTQVDKERVEAEALKKSSNESLDVARQFEIGFEEQVKKLVPQLPVPLQDILKPLLNRIPTDANSRMSAAERVQVSVAMLNELDKFNNAVSIFNEQRKTEKGEEVAVETVYVGLGSAYFVSSTGDFAGTGVPGPTGWQWAIRSEIGPRVKEVVRIYRNERPATFVSLPAVIR